MDDAVEFFNGLSGLLEIEVMPPEKGQSKSTRIKSVALKLSIDDDKGDARALTEKEWERVVIRKKRIRMCSGDTPKVIIEHHAPDGTKFTVRDFADAIVKTERESREHGEWRGGVDVDHILFEGVELAGSVWMIGWGS